MGILLAHISDTHLGYRQYNLYEREEDLYDVFEEAIDEMLREHVNMLIISGDLFHSWRPPNEALYKARLQLSRLRENGVCTFAILGDHDTPRRMDIPPLKLLEDSVHLIGLNGLEGKVVNIKGTRVFIAGSCYIPRRYSGILYDELRQISETIQSCRIRVFTIHQGIYEFLPLDFEIRLSDLPEKFTYYALGHLHKYKEIKFGEGVLSFAGSTEIMRKDEISEWKESGKGFNIVDLSTKEPIVHRVNLSRIRPQLEYDVQYNEIEGRLREIASEIKGLCKKPLLHLNFKGREIDKGIIFEKINKLLGDLALHWRLTFTEDEEKITNVEGKMPSLKELMKEHLKDPLLASFAYELFDVLRHDNIEEAKKRAQEFFKEVFCNDSQ